MAEMDRHRESMAEEMDKLTLERTKIDKMRDNIEKRRQVQREQVDSISDITKRLEEIRTRSKRRTGDAGDAQATPAEEKKE
jgi:hypothetical protein